MKLKILGYFYTLSMHFKDAVILDHWDLGKYFKARMSVG